ncbi:hypothetical protein FBZ89_109220 [Nitrospirillum amazonense]|uniref:Uncharacterized protein n=1 Tax=Nitrospirillum amazonense TaxID=28077 RepID=A0A560FB52_9PROT|nr:hypothetical protein [Nitrospirillum amazonense]TWB18834.1 hypothetical protein FBZ89_109220 [Nitrospirillum amazonense]
MTNTTKARRPGRPMGTERPPEDVPLLAAIADFRLANKAATVTDAIRHAKPDADDTVMHRLRRKFKKHEERLMAEATSRAAPKRARSSNPRSVVPSHKHDSEWASVAAALSRQNYLEPSLAEQALRAATLVSNDDRQMRGYIAAITSQTAMREAEKSLTASECAAMEKARAALLTSSFGAIVPSTVEDVVKAFTAGERSAMEKARAALSMDLTKATQTQNVLGIFGSGSGSAAEAIAYSGYNAACDLAYSGSDAFRDMYAPRSGRR